MGWAAVDSQELRTRENALHAVFTNACFFNTSTNFSWVKMWGPGSAHFFNDLRAVATNACFFNTSTNFSCVKMWGPGSAHFFNALRAVVTNACFFNTSTNFSCVKMWGPGSAHFFNALRAVATNACFFNIHKFLLRKDVRPRNRSFFHCPPPLPACHSCLPISSAVSGANLIFTNNCLGFEAFQISKNRRFWIYQHLAGTARFQRRTGRYLTNSNCFVDHGLYIEKKWAFDISENCDDEPSNPPWYPAGVCAVHNIRPTMIYIPSES